VTALLTMGVSTVFIGLLPTYASIGVMAAVRWPCAASVRAGLGGEWGGAVLLATENALPARALYGMFRSWGHRSLPVFDGVFLLISTGLSNIQLLSGLASAFLASALLVLVVCTSGCNWETPAFKRSIEQGERARAVPGGHHPASARTSVGYLGHDTFVCSI